MESQKSSDLLAPCKCYSYLDYNTKDGYSLFGTPLDIKVDKASGKNHVIVKVGGGWQTLEDYMVRHAPYKFKTREYKRPVFNKPSDVRDIFLGITSHYRTKNPHRLINEKQEKHHVMVKVGGGWETLEDYMERHVPYKFKITEFQRPMHSSPSEIRGMYLGITSHYKSTGISRPFYYSIR